MFMKAVELKNVIVLCRYQYQPQKFGMKCAALMKTTVHSSPCFVLCDAALSYIKILSEVISYEAEEAKTHMERSAGKAFNTREVERCRRL